MKSKDNPVLEAFRDHVAWEWVYLPEPQTYEQSIARFDGLDYNSFIGVSPEQVDFARTVIYRLARAEFA